MVQSILEFRNVTKDFKGDFWKKKIRGLEDVSFSIQDGDIFGLIGPNGAGKTTTIKILMGLIRPTAGEVTVLNGPVTNIQAKHEIGYLPENAYYYDYLRTEEILDFYGRLFGLSSDKRKKRVDELLELVGLSDRKGLRLRNFSKGMLQRIGIAQALVNDPKLVVLDEPMSGLDPIGRKEMRDIILRLSERGKTVLFSSHILSDIEAICEKVGILIKGKMRACGAIDELVHSEIRSFEITFRVKTSDGQATSLPKEYQERISVRRIGDLFVLTTKHADDVYDLVQWGHAKKFQLISVVPQKETLEDIFIEQVEVGA